MINVIPINDDKEHAHSTQCRCSPRCDWTDGLIVIHNSSDCRESVERLLNEGLGQDKEWGVFVSG